MARIPSHADLGLPTPPRGGRWRPAPTPLEQHMAAHNARHTARMTAILGNKPRPLPMALPARLDWLAAAIASGKGIR